MKILINFGPIKSGGGQNVALNFLLGLSEVDLSDRTLVFVVASGSETHRFLAAQEKFRFIVAPRNPVLRLLFERIYISRYIRKNRVDVVYSYFGSGLFGPGVLQVCGSAESNLYYPEVDFWAEYRGFGRLKKFIVDKYRSAGIRRCQGVIYENEALLGRASRVLGVSNGVVIRPSIVEVCGTGEFSLEGRTQQPEQSGLFLCGWQLNKNVLAIPEIARELQQRGQNWHFILTAPPDGSSLHRKFVGKVDECGVAELVTIVGPVAKGQLPSVYGQIDFVFLLSKLESFSNNIIEAWHFGKPLVVSNEDWAKAICGDAAIYVDRDSPCSIAEVLVETVRNPARIDAVVSAGRSQLQRFPAISERIRMELKFVESVVQGS